MILVTGGAGYIGSHTARLLSRQGREVLVLDNLSRGHLWAVQSLPFAETDLTDPGALRAVFRRYPISAVLHFAACAYVGESVLSPGLYYRNNVVGSLNLLDAMVEAGVTRIVFSSSCATYGQPDALPVRESAPQRPINPYGETKLAVERALRWYAQAHGLQWMALRYFNAAGADPEGGLGEAHSPETHLIPLAILAALGQAPPLRVMGADYPTPDCTAVRDYVHVMDLAQAHLLALRRLESAGVSRPLNLGSGRGASVLEVIQAVERISGRPVPREMAPRRAGDPPVLVADPSLAARELSWTPRHSSLEVIVATAWQWHSGRR